MPEQASGAVRTCDRRGGVWRAAKLECRWSALAIGAHAAAPRSATSAVDPATGKGMRHGAGAYADVRRARQRFGESGEVPTGTSAPTILVRTFDFE